MNTEPPNSEIRHNFYEGEVLRIEVYEETPEIRKQTLIREMIQVRKVLRSYETEIASQTPFEQE
jgi:stress response protein YsnF